MKCVVTKCTPLRMKCHLKLTAPLRVQSGKGSCPTSTKDPCSGTIRALSPLPPSGSFLFLLISEFLTQTTTYLLEMYYLVLKYFSFSVRVTKFVFLIHHSLAPGSCANHLNFSLDFLKLIYHT